jgi:H+/gluconate symporter-like permease
MRNLIRLLIALVAAGSGALLGVFIAGAFVSATYSCSPQPGEPCDAGAMVGFGLMLILSPTLSLICGGIAFWAWGRRRITPQDRGVPLR